MQNFITLIAILSLFACSSYRPILNDNEKYLSIGKKRANQDVDLCEKAADDYLKESKMRRMKKEAGRKAVVGGVVGAVTGAVLGHNLKSAAIGSAIGIGAGAVIGGLSVAGEDKVSPDKIKQHYISSCLGKKGYEVIGWE